MRKSNYPTKSELHEMFIEEDGELIYKPRTAGNKGDKRFNTMYAGKNAGCLKKDGYVHITINKRIFLRSNLIWIMKEGAIPDQLTIDHKQSTQKTEDEIKNLRLATLSQQGQNQNHSKHKKSGLPRGVCRIKAGSGNIFYQAKIRFNKKRIHLGTFKTPELASTAYQEASRIHHKEFSLLY